MSNYSRRWTDADIKTVIANKQRGLDNNVNAALLGRTKSAISSLVSKSARYKQIQRLGVPVITPVIPVKSSYPSHWVKVTVAAQPTANASPKLKPINHGKPWTRAASDEICAGFDNGVPLQDIVSRSGRTKASVLNQLKNQKRLSFDKVKLEYYTLPKFYAGV
jgi:hypothetical protein